MRASMWLNFDTPQFGCIAVGFLHMIVEALRCQLADLGSRHGSSTACFLFKM